MFRHPSIMAYLWSPSPMDAMDEPPSSRLQTLPAELRRQIYGYLGFTIQTEFMNRYEEDVTMDLESAVCTIEKDRVRWSPTWKFDEAKDPVENHPSNMPQEVYFSAQFCKNLLLVCRFFANDIYPIIHSKSRLDLTVTQQVESGIRLCDPKFSLMPHVYFLQHIQHVRLGNEMTRAFGPNRSPDTAELGQSIRNLTKSCPSLKRLDLACLYDLLKAAKDPGTRSRIATIMVYAVWNAKYLETIRLCVPLGVPEAVEEAYYLSTLHFPTNLNLPPKMSMEARIFDVAQWTRAASRWVECIEQSEDVEMAMIMGDIPESMQDRIESYVEKVASLAQDCTGARWMEGSK